MKEKMFYNDIFQIESSCEKCKEEIHETLFGIDTSGIFDFNQEQSHKSNEELKREERKAKIEEIFNDEL
jgi:hypothetical protein